MKPVASGAFGGGAVAPLAGAWIETYIRLKNAALSLSRPSRARGLKLPILN